MTTSQPSLIDAPGPPQHQRRTAHPLAWIDSSLIRAVRCRTCKAPILRGPHAEWCAFTIEVDSTPLSAIGEALALLAHRASRPAGTPRLDIYATHACGAAPLPSCESAFTPPPPADPNAECPF
jgi:hypothetical protein